MTSLTVSSFLNGSEIIPHLLIVSMMMWFQPPLESLQMQLSITTAFEIGSAAVMVICGNSCPDIKLSWKDCVTSISGAKNIISVRGQYVVKPTLLFVRITCIINDSAETEERLKYEHAKQTPSLFDKGTMRKSNKSILGSVLKSKVDVRYENPENALYVVDGGHLLLSAVWPTDATYKDACQVYVSHILKYYGPNTTIFFWISFSINETSWTTATCNTISTLRYSVSIWDEDKITALNSGQ